MLNQGKNQLSDNKLEEIAGGGLKERLTAEALGIAALFGPMNGVITEAKGNLSSFPLKSNTIISHRQENSVSEYLTKRLISLAQENAFKTTNNLAKKYKNDHKYISQIVSSNRYYKNTKKTDLEAQLDSDVKNGDLPIPNFTIKDMQNAKDSIISKGNKSVKFVLCPNLDAIKLHETEECRDGDIVNLASQFNALESVSNEPTAVKYWYLDETQGPYCALQSIAATKHREAAHLQDKLTDGLKEALEYCKIDGKPITEKYPNLYKGGYLEMMEITDKQDMKRFLEFLEDEENLTKHMKVLMQWVKCEGTEKKQLQFFTAAPSFQGYSSKIWDSNSELMNLRRKACVKLVEIQYKTMAQAAAVMSAKSRKNIRLHVTMVGHGVFNNPPETVSAAIKTLKEELRGVDATVFLHNRPNKANVWKQKGNLEQLGNSLTPLADWKNGISASII